MKEPIKYKSVKEVVKEVSEIHKVLLLSKNKKNIIKGFQKALCIATGQCVCDLCPKWDKNIFIVFEFGRCMFPSRFFQLVRDAHMKSPRWEAYVKDLYTVLFNTLYEDLLPSTESNIHSLEQESQKCSYSLDPRLVQQAIDLIKKTNLKK